MVYRRAVVVPGGHVRFVYSRRPLGGISGWEYVCLADRREQLPTDVLQGAAA